jgi:hypothetical protein
MWDSLRKADGWSSAVIGAAIEGHDFEEPLRLDLLIDDVLILEFKGTVNGFKASDVTMEPPSSATQAFTLTFKKGVFTNGASISFTIGQNEIGTFKGFTQSEFGVGADALDLAGGATFTAQVSGNSSQTITGAFDTGPATHSYQQGDGFGLIDAISAVQAVTASVKRGK